MSLALCVFVPVGQILVQNWVVDGGGGMVLEVRKRLQRLWIEIE